MEVCEVCGAFLIVGDAQSRVDDHLMGKQHMGYAKIKSTVEELKVTGWPVKRSSHIDDEMRFTQLLSPCYIKQAIVEYFYASHLSSIRATS